MIIATFIMVKSRHRIYYSLKGTRKSDLIINGLMKIICEVGAVKILHLHDIISIVSWTHALDMTRMHMNTD